MNQELFIKRISLPSEHSNNTACEHQKYVFEWTTGLNITIPFGFFVDFLKIKRKLIALTVLHCSIKNILHLLKMFRLFT